MSESYEEAMRVRELWVYLRDARIVRVKVPRREYGPRTRIRWIVGDFYLGQFRSRKAAVWARRRELTRLRAEYVRLMMETILYEAATAPVIGDGMGGQYVIVNRPVRYVIGTGTIT